MNYGFDDVTLVKEEEQSILRLLDRGIDDMEANRELPLDEAFQKIKELRESRRSARA
jgi:hypothetical protein